MANLHLIHYGPGPTSVTVDVVQQLRPFLTANFEVDELDLVKTPPVLFDQQSMAAYVKRNYQGQELTTVEAASLATPDDFAARVLNADFLVMVLPMYNFSVPAAVKAWIDNTVQAKRLFQYTEYGPIGLSHLQTAIIIPVTGSTPGGTAKDFLTPYMEFMLKFIGAKEVIFKGIYGTKFLGPATADKVSEVVNEVKHLLR
jgi:FMN-dependent NADH-azoreductase